MFVYRLSPPLSLPFPRYFSPNREPVHRLSRLLPQAASDLASLFDFLFVPLHFGTFPQPSFSHSQAPSQSDCQETKIALTSLLMTSRQTPTTLDSNQCRMQKTWRVHSSSEKQCLLSVNHDQYLGHMKEKNKHNYGGFNKWLGGNLRRGRFTTETRSDRERRLKIQRVQQATKATARNSGEHRLARAVEPQGDFFSSGDRNNAKKL